MGAREKLLGAKSPTERVYVKALNETFTVRGMTAIERDAFEASCLKGRGRDVSMDNMRAKLVACCVIEEDGTRAFSDEDAIELGQIRADVISQLFVVGQRLSGLGKEEVDELGLSSDDLGVSDTSSSSLH